MKQHPIRKMRRDLERHYLRRVIWPPSTGPIEALLARHIKPLLDALWADHAVCREGVELGDPDTCATCKMLVEWRAKP